MFNVDETGLSTVPNKTPKVISTLGKKSVGKVSSAERGTLVTAVCACSASGVFVPPVLIFPRKKEKFELLNGAPPGTKQFVSDSGYIHSELFLKWLKHFTDAVHPSEDNKILLILDNHSAHVSLEIIQYCRDHHIHLLTIPPHSSQRLQPLDRIFFGVLKNAFSKCAEIWLANHPGRVITQYQVAEIFGQAYLSSVTLQNAVERFSSCCIEPYNPGKFSDIDFLPSSVTDQTEEEMDGIEELAEFNEDVGNLESRNDKTNEEFRENDENFEPPQVDQNSVQVPEESNKKLRKKKEPKNADQNAGKVLVVQDILPLPKIKVTFY